MQQTVNPAFCTSVLDALSDAIVWMHPVFTPEGNIEDFEVGYANKAADVGISHPKGKMTGLRILKDGVPSRESAEANFQHYLDVYQSGETREYTFFAHHSNRLFETVRKPHEGGVLSTTKDRSAQREAERKEQVTKRTLQSIINSSSNGIALFSALRDKSGEIKDFQVRNYNQCRNELLGLTKEEGAAFTFRQILQVQNAESFFDMYVEVVETGVSMQREQFVERSKKWISLSTVKLDDGFLTMLTDVTKLKESEQALQKQSAYLTGILNTSLNAVITMEAVRNPEGSIVDFRYKQVNKRFLEWLSRTEEEVIGGYMVNLFPNTIVTGIFDVYRQAVESGVPQHSEVNYSDENIDVWYDLSVARLDENTAVGTFNDITQRRKAHELVHQQKTFLDNVLQYSPAGITITEVIRDEAGNTIDGRTILTNEQGIEFTGIPKDILLTRTLAEIDPAILSSQLFQLTLHTLQTGEPFHTQYFFAPTGRWLDLSVSKMDDDRLINIFTDITSTKEAQLLLEQTSERLHAVFNASQSGLLTLSPVLDSQGEIVDFRFVIVNPAYAALVGHSQEVLQNTVVSSLFPTYLRNGVFDFYKQTYLTGETKRQDVHYHFDGLDVYLDLLATKVGDEVLVTLTDYTPLKKTQLELELLINELRRSNTSLEEFAHAASHDLKEPIRKISTFSGRLKSSLEDRMTGIERGIFERMQNATERMTQLVDDLLTYSHLSYTSMEMEEVDLNEKIRMVLMDLEVQIEEKKAVIQLDLLPTIKGYRRQLQQLFQNLISNALKYSRPGVHPQVAISSRMVLGAEVPVNLPTESLDKHYHLIEVRDNGIGFEQQHADKIFQIFQRLHGKSEYPGTGIGLSIVRKVVDNHKGYIWAESEPGKGATFYVLLPQ